MLFVKYFCLTMSSAFPNFSSLFLPITTNFSTAVSGSVGRFANRPYVPPLPPRDCCVVLPKEGLLAMTRGARHAVPPYIIPLSPPLAKGEIGHPSSEGRPLCLFCLWFDKLTANGVY